MSFQYVFVFAVLLMELAVVGILLVPMPRILRRAVIGAFIAGMSNWRVVGGGGERMGGRMASWTLQGALFLVSVFFLDSVHKVFKIYALKESLEGGMDSSQRRVDLGLVHAKLFYAQRNVYLTGLVLVLFVVLKLLASLFKKKQILEAKIESLYALNVRLEEEKSAVEKQNEALASLKQARPQQHEYLQLSRLYETLEKLE